MKAKSIFFCLLFFAGCNASRIISSWHAPHKQPVASKKILVLALSQPDNKLRQAMEQHLVDDMRSHNLNAVAAFNEYGPKEFEGLGEKEVLTQIQNQGIDAVITIVLLSKSKEKSYVRGHIYYTPYAIYYNRFWGYYNTIHTRIYSPGYYVTNTEYFWESNLYQVSSGELIYSVQTKSFNPGNAASLAHEYGLLIIHDMIRNGVIAASRSETKN